MERKLINYWNEEYTMSECSSSSSSSSSHKVSWYNAYKESIEFWKQNLKWVLQKGKGKERMRTGSWNIYRSVSPLFCTALCKLGSNEEQVFHNNARTRGWTRGWSQSVTMWSRVISFSERQPLNAMVSSNSSRSICNTFLTPASPSAAKENTTGRPIWYKTNKPCYLLPHFLFFWQHYNTRNLY